MEAARRSQSLADTLKGLYCACKFLVLKDDRSGGSSTAGRPSRVRRPGALERRNHGLLPLEVTSGPLRPLRTRPSHRPPPVRACVPGHLPLIPAAVRLHTLPKLVLYAANAVLFEREGKEQEVLACSFHRYCQLLTQQAFTTGGGGPLQGLRLAHNAVRRPRAWAGTQRGMRWGWTWTYRAWWRRGVGRRGGEGAVSGVGRG